MNKLEDKLKERRDSSKERVAPEILSFDITGTIESIYEGFGIDLEKSQGNRNRILPIPATYILDSSRTIIYAYINADYTKRAEPQEVIDKYLELFNDKKGSNGSN